jgi:hypothetical protein
VESHDYDAAVTVHRKHLAQRLVLLMAESGFIEEYVADKGTKERVFYRLVDGSPGVRVQVYTTIVGFGEASEVRLSGKDAIRVCAVYRTKSRADRGIVAVTRVHRTGTVEGICERTLSRMRDVYRSAATSSRCSKCGAPMFVSKKANLVCADLCFSRM